MQWTIETTNKRESRKSVLAARHDDDEIKLAYLFDDVIFAISILIILIHGRRF